MSAVRQQALREWTDPDTQQQMNGTHFNGSPANGAHRGGVQAKNRVEAPGAVASTKQSRSKGEKETRQDQSQSSRLTMERQLRRTQDVLGNGRLMLLQLAEQLDELSPELEATATKITRFKESRARLQRDLDAARAHAEDLHEQQQQLRIELESVKAEAERLGESRNLLQTELEEAKPELEKLRRHAAELEHALCAVRIDRSLNEYRARHRKRERDRYRHAIHATRYFLFKPRLMRGMKAELEEKARLIEDSGIFDASWYVEQHPDASADPIRHYLWEGAIAGANPHPLFDSTWYIHTCAAVRKSGENPLLHYLGEGWRKRRSPSPWFDVKWYVRRYPEVALQDTDPLRHFLSIGWREGKQPHPAFDSDWYQKTYKQRLSVEENPLIHYLKKGRAEGCLPNRHATPQEPPTIATATGYTWPITDQANTEAVQELNAALQRQVRELEANVEQRFKEIATLTRQLEERNLLRT